MTSSPTRGLSTAFRADLQPTGPLGALVERVRLDRTLCLEIREDYLNVYYRGGSVLRLTHVTDGYLVHFDQGYLQTQALSRPTKLSGVAEIVVWLGEWLTTLPTFKNVMDLFFGAHPKEEREAQQALVRENNFCGQARSTDYYICDIEYASPLGRFDFIAVHWPSTSMDRKLAHGRQLVVGEVKYGDGALDGDAGVHAHVRGVNDFFANPARAAALKSEMVEVFAQKRALQLVDCGKDLAGFSDEPPVLLLVFANHDPGKTRLRELLATLPPSPNLEVRVAMSGLVGYGLYDPGIVTVAQALASRNPLI